MRHDWVLHNLLFPQSSDVDAPPLVSSWELIDLPDANSLLQAAISKAGHRNGRRCTPPFTPPLEPGPCQLAMDLAALSAVDDEHPRRRVRIDETLNVIHILEPSSDSAQRCPRVQPTKPACLQTVAAESNTNEVVALRVKAAFRLCVGLGCLDINELWLPSTELTKNCCELGSCQRSQAVAGPRKWLRTPFWPRRRRSQVVCQKKAVFHLFNLLALQKYCRTKVGETESQQ